MRIDRAFVSRARLRELAAFSSSNFLVHVAQKDALFAHADGQLLAREDANQNGFAQAIYRAQWEEALKHRAAYELAQKTARLGRGPLADAALRPWTRSRELPEVPAQSFRDWWREHRA